MDSKLIQAYESVIEDLYGDGGNPEAIDVAIILLAKRKAELENWHLYTEESN